MKYMKTLLILIILQGLFAQDFEPPVGALTVDKACRMALENNPEIKTALKRIKQVDAILKQNKAAFMPNVVGGASVNAYNASQEPQWAPHVHARESFNQAGVYVQASYMIFDGFARQAKVLESKYNTDNAREQMFEIRRLLLEAVSTAFYQAQLSVENMAIARQNRDFNKILEQDARKRWQAGTIPEANMLNFSVKALQAETDFLTSQRDFKIICTALAELMAMPNALLVKEMYPVRSDVDITLTELDVDARIVTALQKRPDLKAVESQISAQKENVRKQKAVYSPEVALVAGIDYYKSDISDYDQDESTSFIGLTATWDLYSGGSKRQKVLGAQAGVEALNHAKTQKVLAIQSAVRKAVENASITYETYLRNKQILELTMKIRDHVEKSYKAGTESLTRLNEAQTDQVNAAGALVAAKIQYQLAIVSLEAQTGEIAGISE